MLPAPVMEVYVSGLMLVSQGVSELKRGGSSHTSSAGTECPIAMATLDASSNDFAIDVLGSVSSHVAGAATAVRNLGSHG